MGKALNSLLTRKEMRLLMVSEGKYNFGFQERGIETFEICGNIFSITYYLNSSLPSEKEN
jgi:hypothetical protein